MPEYLTPGVYVEETSFRSRSIEGVATSTFGMAGVTEYGPVPYVGNGATMLPTPTLITSFTEYERAFGGLLVGDQPCHVAFAARAFFGNGGQRLYVSRVFDFPPANDANFGSRFGQLSVPAGQANPVLAWRARWPGSVSSRIKVTVTPKYSRNVIVTTKAPDGTDLAKLVGLREGAAVVLGAATDKPPPTTTAPGNVRIVGKVGQVYGYRTDTGIDPVQLNTTAFHLTFDISVELDDRLDVYNGLELDAAHPRALANYLQARDPADEMSLVWFDQTPAQGAQAPTPIDTVNALWTLAGGGWLSAGQDATLTADLLLGQEPDPDNPFKPGLGLGALGEVDDIAIVATPDTVSLSDGDEQTGVSNLLEHCESLRYRIAIVDPPADQSISEVREFRSLFDSKYGALYYPWLRIVDPTRPPDPSIPTPTLDIPPSGSVAGIYARSDIARGVHKAPANEVVMGITKFVTNVTYNRQAVLNPEGINALRFFEGRSNRVWGARTMSSDPEWKYVNVRRLFIYLEHSIDNATQWAVFEPNNERLWGSIKQSIEDFLITVWRDGALMGTKPEEAFFVRCDRTTMTQNDLDNGRMICLIGVAPTYPAEFVIFRIGQWTADSRTA
jgi:phage tail sheath protein FI